MNRAARLGNRMEERIYRTFELRIGPTGAGYHVSAKGPDGAESDGDFAAPMTGGELDGIAERIWQLQPGVRRDIRDNGGIQLIQQFGTLLFETVFGTEVLGRLRSSIDHARRENEGLRIQLNLTDVPELSDLPWEYLYDATDGNFFGRSRDTPLVRFLSIPRGIRS
jgi:hypothetical protein